MTTTLSDVGPIDLALVEKALGKGLQVARYGHGWRVQSGPNTYYVTLDASSSCTCIAGQHRARNCSHRAAAGVVAALLGEFDGN